MRVYLDNASTTRVDGEVLEAMKPYFTKAYGNTESLHQLGEEAFEKVRECEDFLLEKLGGRGNIVFTSGGTESNNLALKGVAYALKDKGGHIVTSKAEHSSILKTCRWLEKNGFEVTYLDVDKYGLTPPEKLEAVLREDTILASIMHANNEVGSINDIEVLGRVCRENDVYFHTDACQSMTKTSLDFEKMNVDLASINGHKIHGPKGVGGLYVREGVKLNPIQHGGGHQKGLRSGTVDVASIVGFSKAFEVGGKKDAKHMIELRDFLIKKLLEIDDCWLNGHPEKRLCNDVNIGFDFIEGESLLMRLNMHGIYVSTASACSSKNLNPSHVLTAMGLPAEKSHGSVRITLSKYNTMDEMRYVVEKIRLEVEFLRKLSPVGGG